MVQFIKRGLICFLLLLLIVLGWYIMYLSPKVNTCLENGRLFLNIGNYSKAAAYYQKARSFNQFSGEAQEGIDITSLYYMKKKSS